MALSAGDLVGRFGRRVGVAVALALLSASGIAALAPAPAAAQECPNEEIRAQQEAFWLESGAHSAPLPDCRAFELVTPVDKGPAGQVAAGIRQTPPFLASQDGGSFLWPLQNGLPETTAGGWLRLRATRTEAGWDSEQVSPPSLVAPVELELFGEPSQVLYASADLGCALVQTFQPLTDDIPPLSLEEGVQNLFRWNGAEGSYDLISNRLPLNPGIKRQGTAFYDRIEASADCDRVFFESDYELLAGASGQYEWSGGELRDAGLLPDGTVPDPMPSPLGTPERAVRGGEFDSRGSARWNAVTPEGSLFFTALSNEGPDAGTPAVFMREDGGAAVLDLSQSQIPAVPTNGARFEAASRDGGTVIFRANYGIAAQSSDGPTGQACGPISGETIYQTVMPIEAKPCDLYAYDVESGALTDISADANPADAGTGARVQGTVAVDEDGSHVYFAALGQLIPGEGRTYAQNVPDPGAGFEGSANVYLHHEGELTYVTTLVARGVENARDLTFGALMRRPAVWRAATSEDGSRLLFSASTDIAGYDGGGGQVAYAWSADTETLSCVSCPPGGGPTTVKPDGRVGGKTDAPLVLDQGRTRKISADGDRVFFTSSDVLAPGAALGKRNVYQWAEGEVSFLAVAQRAGTLGAIPELGKYAGAGADGESAFIATNERLVPQDRDFLTDVYAVRVNGGFLFVPPPPPCQVDDSAPLEPGQTRCQGEPEAQPDDAPPASAAPLVGSGNVTPNPCRRRARRAQRLSKRAKALRRRARAAARASKRGVAKRNAKRARRAAKGARRNSKAAKRCRRRARAADVDRGGAR